jgi:hypothetical protein
MHIEAEARAQLRHLSLHLASAQGLAAQPDEKRSLRRQLMRTGGEVIADRFHDHGQDRHEPRLAAFAGDGDRAGLCRSRAARKAERFADAQAAAIEQHQNREVALALPGPRGDGGGFVERVLRLFDR